VTFVTKRRKPAENCQKRRHKPESRLIGRFYAVQHKNKSASTPVNERQLRQQAQGASGIGLWRQYKSQVSFSQSSAARSCAASRGSSNSSRSHWLRVTGCCPIHLHSLQYSLYCSRIISVPFMAYLVRGKRPANARRPKAFRLSGGARSPDHAPSSSEYACAMRPAFRPTR
jgi:hypothetical protein